MTGSAPFIAGLQNVRLPYKMALVGDINAIYSLANILTLSPVQKCILYVYRTKRQISTSFCSRTAKCTFTVQNDTIIMVIMLPFMFKMLSRDTIGKGRGYVSKHTMVGRPPLQQEFLLSSFQFCYRTFARGSRIGTLARRLL